MPTENITNHIVNWLKTYVQKSQSKGFVVGVSGGIDSAVTSTLCALTGFPTLCVDMPIHQSQNQIDRAHAHIEWLQKRHHWVRFEKVALSDVYDGLIKAFPVIENEEDRLMALVNTRARLRMTTLYYFAGLHNYLVSGTGNKVEDFGVGFFTKYGDGGVDLSPIADLTKTEVYALAKYLGVNKDIIVAPPTDGLWGDDRTDEDQIGASYPELEWAMDMADKNHVSSDFTNRQKEVFAIYTKLHNANKHKMIPIPVCEIPNELK
ncbi:MAG: NAD(+) synthase [Flavobacteriaceae bacterium]|nr:NAD(+) synthase [Flavobacteriaceae bacterium]